MFNNQHSFLGFYTLKVRSRSNPNSYDETYIMNPYFWNQGLNDRLGQFAIFMAEMANDYQKAEKYFLKAIEKDPNNYFWLGNFAVFLHYYKKDYTKALYYYEKSLKYNPEDSFLLINYAHLKINFLNDINSGEELLKKAIKVDRYNSDAYGAYALFLYKIKQDYRSAIGYAFWAYRLDKDNPYWQLLLAQLKIFIKSFDEAEQILDKLYNKVAVTYKSVLLELWYLRYAYFPKWLDTAKREILSLLKEEVAIEIINIEANLSIAIKTHPDPTELHKISLLIMEKVFNKEVDQY